VIDKAGGVSVVVVVDAVVVVVVPPVPVRDQYKWLPEGGL
jgi:hypothetical protein